MSHPKLNKPSPELLDRFTAIVGPANALRDPDLKAPFLREWRDKYFGESPMVLRPGSTEEVSAILKLANEARVAVVPQAGNTGLVGGQIPFEGGDEIVVSVARLNRVRDADSQGSYLTVEAGMTLQAVQAEADARDRLFPLSLGSEGTCQIGGNLATNAGGVGVLAYGNARQLVSGLEVVTADGRIWDGLRALKKDNTGYDLRDLFIGSEGTLGIITAAVLKLFPRPAEMATGFVALDSLEAALELFRMAGKSAGTSLTAFEFMPRIAIEFVTRHVDGARDPLSEPAPWYVLIEISGSQADGGAQRRLEAILGEALEAEVIGDATLAASQAQRMAFWRIREDLSEVQKHEGGSIKHDVSVPIAGIPRFIAEAGQIVERLCPGVRPVAFGHFGDGNIHYNLSQPIGMDKAAYLAMWDEMSKAVHDLVHDMNGSISAEHGIGRMKREMLTAYKSEVELDMMRRIKAAFDPNGILNPGKVV